MKKYMLIILVFIVIVLVSGSVWHFLNRSQEIPNNYIAVFNGGAGEQTYSTYIYKIENVQANMGFKYINTTNTTVSWGSSEVNVRVTGKGKVTWTDDVFPIAKKNHAYSYVSLPDNTTLTIEEFQARFIMN